MDNYYTRHAINAAVEARLRSEGKPFRSRAPSRDILMKMFLPMSDFCRMSLSMKGYEVSLSKDLLGYTKFIYNKFTIHVPHALASSFPEPHQLDSIIEIANKISGNRPINILVSGSAALRGDLPAIGDLDFCEYFERFGGDFLNNQVPSQISDNRIIAVSLEWGKKKIFYPFDNCAQLIDEARIAFQQMAKEAFNSWKLDCVGFVVDNEVLPITRVSIPVDFESWEATAAGKSWAFQEALISERGDAPRELTTFGTLGAYINWLLGQSRGFAQAPEGIAKAAKRAYSLANVTVMHQRSAEIKDAVCQPELELDIRMSALIEAKSFLDTINHPGNDVVKAVNDQIRAQKKPNKKGLAIEQSRLKKTLVDFMDEVESKIDEARLEYG